MPVPSLYLDTSVLGGSFDDEWKDATEELWRQLRDGVGGFNALQLPSSVAISGNLAIVTAPGEDAVTILDISDPAVPVLKTELRDGVGGFNGLNGATGVAISGNLAIVTTSIESAVTILDISNPAAPVLKAELRDNVGGFNRLFGVNGVAVSGNLAIVTSNESAVTILDFGRRVDLITQNSVGIGTATPTAELEVVGTVKASTLEAGTVKASKLEGSLVITPTGLSPVAGSVLPPMSGYLKPSPASAVVLNATTAIADGAAVGQVLILQGTSDTNTVTLNDGANVQLGATRTLGLNDTLSLIWDGANWIETAFSNN